MTERKWTLIFVEGVIFDVRLGHVGLDEKPIFTEQKASHVFVVECPVRLSDLPALPTEKDVDIPSII